MTEQEEHDVSDKEENVVDRIKNKFKKQAISINITPNVDITDLAIQKYSQVKKQYCLTSFQEADKSKKYLNGTVENYVIPIHDFNHQMHQFRKLGFCSNPDPNVKSLVFSSKNADLKEMAQQEGVQINLNHEEFMNKLYGKTTNKNKKELTKYYKNLKNKDQAVFSYQGPWAGYGQNLQNGALTNQQKVLLEGAEQRKRIRVEEAQIQEKNFEPYNNFHWDEYKDYKGQSYVDPPANLRAPSGGCYLPKKNIHTWAGSQKEGIQVVRFFPKYGHFILTANPEGKVQLFDVMRNRTCAHTYVGHTKAVRDIQFTNDGKHFLSCGFDGQVQYWDTQYGKVNRTFKLKKIPFCVRFHSSPGLQNVFLCGSSSKKIYQFDLNTGTKTLEYNQHLSTVNTITFIEENKFVSSSDDKKLFIWEYGIPVVTRHVSEPEMHTITATALHPNGQFFAGQSSDNQIVVYENKGGNFRRIRSKKFNSHFCAGYACGLDFSYDGQFLLSGDERGKIFCYDWKTSKNYRTLDGHAGACVGLEWHPLNPTMVVSVGWEGQIKLWE